MKNILRMFVVCALSIGAAMAQYVREGAIGTVKPQATAPRNPYPTISMQEWVGKRILFLPQPVKLQEFGYQSFDLDTGDWLKKHCSYAECSGKIARIIAIKDGEFPQITVEVEETKRRFVGTVYLHTLRDVTLLDDLDAARQEFPGKTLWVKQTDAATYDPATDSYGSIPLRKWGPVKVVDVIAGHRSDLPIRFIVENERGEQGYIDTHLSDTNVNATLAQYGTFGSVFLRTDPRPQYKIPARVWQLIEREEVEVGMTKEQVVLSWGTPNKSVTKTIAQNAQTGETIAAGSATVNFSGENEQWEYRRGAKTMLLRFKGNIVDLIETAVR